MFLIVLIGFLYLFLGSISLLTSILFIEIGRPKDILQSGLSILLGTFLIIYKNIFTIKISLILTLNVLLLISYLIENFLYRWNLLLEKEKFDIISFSGLKKNFFTIYEIISIDFKNLFFNKKIKNIFKHPSIKKKWIRKKEKENNPIDKEASLKEYMKNIQTADFSKKDIINDEKNNTKNTKID